MKKRNIALIMTCWTLLYFGSPADAAQPPLYENLNRPASHDRYANFKAPNAQKYRPTDAVVRDFDPNMGMAPSVFVSHEPGDAGANAVVVEKSSQTLILYDMFQTPKEIFRLRCSTGKNYGPKTLSGDAKTPEGVYFFTQEHDEKYLTPVYGVKAFPTDYPNLLDRLALRTGSAIWLHGTDKLLTPYDSNGCVAVENADLLALSPFITVNRTPIIIVEKLQYRPMNAGHEEATAVADLLKRWHTAIETAAYEDYIGCYGGAAPAPPWWSPWEQSREALLSNHVPVMLEAKNIAVYRHRNTLVAVFDQYLQADDSAAWVGTKKFFLEPQDGRLVILGDTYQAPSDIGQDGPMENPLIAVSRSLEQALGIAREETEPAETTAGIGEAAIPIEQWLDEWLMAWSSKDLKTYGDFYADDFRSQGMNKNAWLNYKRNVNRKYRFIRLSKKDIVLAPLDNQLVVSFTQEFESNAFRSVGTKKLVLIRQNEAWKIYRETFEKM